jgi:hypothetical protein
MSHLTYLVPNVTQLSLVAFRLGLTFRHSGLRNGDIADGLAAGPHFAHNVNSRVTLFAHALAGFTRGERCTAGCYIYVPPPIPLAGAQQEGNAFPATVGGGVDVRIFRFFWFRPAQADYVHVFFPSALASPNPSSPENNLQLAFVFTFRFGSRKG